MHTRQGAAEPARSQHNPAPDGNPREEYLFANLLGQGPNRSRIAVGPEWLESFITFYVLLTSSSRRRVEKLDAIRLILLAVALLATVAALLVGER